MPCQMQPDTYIDVRKYHSGKRDDTKRSINLCLDSLQRRRVLLTQAIHTIANQHILTTAIHSTVWVVSFWLIKDNLDTKQGNVRERNRKTARSITHRSSNKCSKCIGNFNASSIASLCNSLDNIFDVLHTSKCFALETDFSPPYYSEVMLQGRDPFAQRVAVCTVNKECRLVNQRDMEVK